MEVYQVSQSGPYTSRALLPSLKPIHLRMMQLKRKKIALLCSQNDLFFFCWLVWLIILFYMSSYDLQLDIIRQDFKSGLEALLKANPIRAIFLGVRIGDPTAVSFTFKSQHSYSNILYNLWKNIWSLWLIGSHWLFFSGWSRAVLS